MTDPLNTGPTAAAPATVSTNVAAVVGASAFRTLLTGTSLAIGALQAYQSGHLSGAVAYLQANEAAADGVMAAGAVAFGWGITKVLKHARLLARAAEDRLVSYIRPKS